MKIFLRALVPLVILGGCIYAAVWFIRNPPALETKETGPTAMRVEGTILRRSTFPVRVKSQGTVQPRTRSTLLPEVTATILEVSPSFRPGGFFSKGDLLVKLDPVDYETAIVVARAQLAQAEVTLAEEQAKASQALENWRALGKTGQPSPLVMRAPQVAKADADVAAAKAQITKAERDLTRTEIRAPYDGQVLEQLADVGQHVNEGTPLGKIFAVDYVEIRLPLPERGLRFLTLPEPFRDNLETPGARPVGTPVTIRSHIDGKPASWTGNLVRVESAIDESTRQITAVAQVNDPYAKREDGRPPLKIGQFVEAEIEGDLLTDVFVIPRNAVRAGNEIILISEKNLLKRTVVEPLIADESSVVVALNSPGAPREGDRLCLTPIPFAAEGALVDPKIDNALENPGVAGSRETKPDKAPLAAETPSPKES